MAINSVNRYTHHQKIVCTEVGGTMSDETANKILDMTAGLLFGLGFGMIIGHYLIP